jgi:hypothetical protein
MSFNDLSISIVAQNLASAEFAQVAADAGAMAAQITGTSNSVSVLGSEFAQTGAEASNLGAGAVEGAGGLTQLGDEAEVTSIKLSTVARGISSVSSLGLGLTVLATDFGLVDSQSAKWVRTVLATITVVSEVARLISYSTLLTTGHAAAIGINTTMETANTSASIASTVARNIKTAATWIAVTAENALNISQATFLALTGIGIAVIIAAAVAVAYFASQMNAATASVTSFNASAVAVPGTMSGIQRGGTAGLLRRGVE